MLRSPGVLRPGNNEWADCWKANRGAADPTKYHADARSVLVEAREPSPGAPAAGARVRRDPGVRRFFRKRALDFRRRDFATLNLAGTHNNQELRVRILAQVVRREQASLPWGRSEFAEARRGKQRAVVLAFHSNPFNENLRYDGGPFESVVKAIDSEAEAFDGQVLIVQGHYHEFVIDRPLTQLDLESPA